MLKIGVLSDTHIHHLHQGVTLLEELLADPLADVDLILHAGDMVHPGLLTLFSGVPVHAVRGNMDPPVTGVPLKKVITVAEDCRIGLMHGWGPPDNLEERLLQEFSGQALDCLVYGHSHVPACHRHHGLLMFNPGSPTDPRQGPAPSVGILEVDKGISGRIVFLDVP